MKCILIDFINSLFSEKLFSKLDLFRRALTFENKISIYIEYLINETDVSRKQTYYEKCRHVSEIFIYLNHSVGFLEYNKNQW